MNKLANVAAVPAAGHWSALVTSVSTAKVARPLLIAGAGMPTVRGTAMLRRNLMRAALLVGLALGSVLPAMAAGRAAYVEAVLPSKPFKLTVNVRQFLFEDVFVIGDGAFGITGITATNQENVPRTLIIYEASAAFGRGCGTPTSSNYNNLPIAIPAFSTVQLTFPTPLVFNATNGHTCIRMYINENSSMQVLLNGLTN